MGEADTADGKRVKTVSGGLWRKRQDTYGKGCALG